MITSVVSNAVPNYAGRCDATEDPVEEADSGCFDATVDLAEDVTAAYIGIVSDAAANYEGRFEAPADPVEEAAVIADLAVVVASADKEAGGAAKVTKLPLSTTSKRKSDFDDDDVDNENDTVEALTDNLSVEFATEEPDNSDALPLGQKTLAAAQHIESVYLYILDNEQEIILKDRESRRTHWEVLMVSFSVLLVSDLTKTFSLIRSPLCSHTGIVMPFNNKHFQMKYPNVIREYGRVHVRYMLCKLLCSACSDPAYNMGSLVEWSADKWQSLLNVLELTRNACSRVDCGVITPAAVAADEAGTVEDKDKVNSLCDKELFVIVQTACEINKLLGTIRSMLQMQIDRGGTGVPNLNPHDVDALL